MLQRCWPPREEPTQYHIQITVICLPHSSIISWHCLPVWFSFVLASTRAQNWAWRGYFQTCSIQDARASHTVFSFPNSHLHLTEEIASNIKLLLISFLLRASQCFRECHTFEHLERDTSGVFWLPEHSHRLGWHLERNTINVHFFRILQSVLSRKWGGEKPQYCVSNKLRNFFDFHDVHMAVNFNVILWFLAEPTVCMYGWKQAKQMHFVFKFIQLHTFLCCLFEN